MERNAPPTLEITLPDGSVAEVDGTTEFTSRVDKMEDRVNDGNRYKGLLSKEDYDKRKRKLNDKLRQEADPEKYKLEKLEVRAPLFRSVSLTLSLARSHALAAPRAAPRVHRRVLARFSSSNSHPWPTQTPSRETQTSGHPHPPPSTLLILKRKQKIAKIKSVKFAILTRTSCCEGGLNDGGSLRRRKPSTGRKSSSAKPRRRGGCGRRRRRRSSRRSSGLAAGW